MHRTVWIAALALALAPSAAGASDDGPFAAEVPGVVPIAVAQIDDSDLDREETLEDLQNEEYGKEAWSTGKAIGLSMVPGGGFGLMYADNRAAAIIPFALSLIGYGLGAAYIAGVFDEESTQVCRHERDGVVPIGECDFGTTSPKNTEVDPRATNAGDRYFDTKSDYNDATTGEDFAGATTGIVIIAATYAATTLLGAIWSASNVSDHNDEVRKSIESTAKTTAPIARPVAAYDGDRGYFGLAIDF